MGSLAWEAPFRGMRATEHRPPPAPAVSRWGLTWVLTPEKALGRMSVYLGHESQVRAARKRQLHSGLW